MYDQILVPTDGSEVAETAADQAVALARQFGAELHVLHVLEVGELPPGVEDEGASELAHLGEEAAEAVADRAAEAGLTATATVVEGDGSIHRAILTFADENDTDCIVMGTHGRTGIDRFVLGSVAEQTVRESPVPVFTVHEDTAVQSDLDDVLVPTDGSNSALAAADHAIDLAAATDAALHVVYAVKNAGVYVENPGTVLDALEQGGQRAVDEVVERATAADLSTVEASILRGTPYRAIVDYADDHGVDVIVMGTHGRTGLDRYLLGSVTERVLRISDVPVLTVGRPEDGD